MASATVKPAPKLSFPISNYGQCQPKANTMTKVTKTKSGFPVELDNVLSTEMEMYILGIEDIRTLMQEKRQVLLQGPKAQVKVDGEVLENLPFHLFLAVSPLVRNLYIKSDKHYPTSINFKGLDKRTTKTLITYLKEIATKSKCFLLQKSQDGQLRKDLLLLRTAEGLGMRPLVNHIACNWLKDIRTRGRVPTIQEQNAAEEFYTTGDPICAAIAKRIAHYEVVGVIEHRPDFYIAHPKLFASVKSMYDELMLVRTSRK
ncbi:hypothetical protein EJ07DRAFT_177057 [Lizonia empirigonia]|nr:hypothetical protein EJ07DRAFT_177057 [Lizonia empirigonia]